MLKMLRVAAIAVPAALTVMAPIEARANPMVAVGWLWAAGAGGLLLGFLGGQAWANNHATVIAPVQAAPVDYQVPCRQARVRYQGRWHNVQICD